MTEETTIKKAIKAAKTITISAAPDLGSSGEVKVSKQAAADFMENWINAESFQSTTEEKTWYGDSGEIIANFFMDSRKLNLGI